MNTLYSLLQDRSARVPVAIVFLLVAFQTLIGPLDIASNAQKMKVGLDETVAVKLLSVGLMAMAALWGFLRFADVRRTLVSIPALVISVLLLLTLVGASSGLITISPVISFINFITFVFVTVALTLLGFRVFGLAILCGITINAIWGLGLFYFVPEKGTFLEPIDNGGFLARLGGLAHPNSIGRSMVLGAILTLFLFRVKELPAWVAAPCVLLYGWTIVLAKSRTAIVAGFVAMLLASVDQLRTKASIVAFTTATTGGMALLLFLFATGSEERVVDKLVGLVAKTGKAEEITSGTGRTDIWAEASKHIAERPLLGYGLNVGPVLLIDHSQATHNAIVNATLSGGAFGGLIMIGLQLWLVWLAVSSPHLAIRGIAAFLFFSCLTEDTVLETFPGPATMLWYACYIMQVLPASVVNRAASRLEPVHASALDHVSNAPIRNELSPG
jgi:O-antigen ligase